MAFLIFNRNGYFRWNNEMWHRLLELAHEYGWKPSGALPPKDDRLIGHEFPEGMKSYLFNEEQIVTDEDADNLLGALERALEDIQEEQMTEIKFRTLDEYEAPRSADLKFHKTLNIPNGGFGFTSPDPNTPNQIYFSGEYKDKLRKFIAFCRKGGGGFMIG